MSNIDSPVTRSERELFLEALEKTEGAEREAFLVEIGSDDPALRAAVEELLRNHKNDDFMESPRSPGQGDGSLAPAEGDGGGCRGAARRPVGPYKLLQQIGEGGVGIVFMAEQEVPVRRRVALKVLKPGMDTQVCDRALRVGTPGPGVDGPSEYRQGAGRREHGGRSSVFRDGSGARHSNHGVLRSKPTANP